MSIRDLNIDPKEFTELLRATEEMQTLWEQHARGSIDPETYAEALGRYCAVYRALEQKDIFANIVEACERELLDGPLRVNVEELLRDYRKFSDFVIVERTALQKAGASSMTIGTFVHSAYSVQRNLTRLENFSLSPDETRQLISDTAKSACDAAEEVADSLKMRKRIEKSSFYTLGLSIQSVGWFAWGINGTKVVADVLMATLGHPPDIMETSTTVAVSVTIGKSIAEVGKSVRDLPN